MKKLLALVLAGGLAAGCADRTIEIKNALAAYDKLTFHLAGDSLADMYAVDGQLGGKGMKPVVGRDSIRKFLKSFEGSSIKMIANETKATTILFKNDTAFVEGSYQQKVKSPQGDTGLYAGTFKSQWIPVQHRWLLIKMFTSPANTSTIKSVLLRQLKTTHTDKDWFVPANVAVEGLTSKQAMWKDGSGNHSIGQLAAHLVFWNERLLKKFKGEPESKFSGDNEETFNSFDEKSWEETVRKLDAILTDWELAIKKADDEKLTDWYENIANMSTHNAYHTGQIIFLRKLQGNWDATKGVK
jgi:hypothetical protein